MYSERNVHLLRHTGYPIRKSSGQSLVAAHRGLSQLKHVLHRLLAPRHSPCALSNLFLDPIIFTALKQKKKKLISKPFSLKFCKIEPGQSSAKGSINKIADRSMKTFKIKETKLSLEEMMKKGSHNHEPSSHSH